MGAKRYIDRGNFDAPSFMEGSIRHAWENGALTCPAGKYSAELQSSLTSEDRLSIETPRLDNRKSCERCIDPHDPLFSNLLQPNFRKPSHRCPRGRFGATEGLESANQCTRCPVGRYGILVGAADADDACRLCPRGTYGSERGLLTSACSGDCPVGRYGPISGLTRASQCAPCPVGYTGSYQCGTAALGAKSDPADGGPLSQYSGGQVAFGGRGFETRVANIAQRNREWSVSTRSFT